MDAAGETGPFLWCCTKTSIFDMEAVKAAQRRPRLNAGMMNTGIGTENRTGKSPLFFILGSVTVLASSLRFLFPNLFMSKSD